MSEDIRKQFRQQIDQAGLYTRLLTTAEASAATGLSEYELRNGARDGRYPVILTGRPGNKFRKMRWNLSALNDALRQQMNINFSGEEI